LKVDSRGALNNAIPVLPGKIIDTTPPAVEGIVVGRENKK